MSLPLLPITAVAQDDALIWSQVRTFQVKSGMQGEFIAAQKTFTEAMAAAERPGRTVWQETVGDLGVFHMVTRRENLASFDEQLVPPMEEDAWEARGRALTAATESITRVILRRHPELGISPGEDQQPAMLSLTYFTLAPGKSNEFSRFLQSKFIPALKAGGATGLTVSRVYQGGDRNTWIFARLVDNWAQLDSPGALAHMSEEERIALLAGFGDMIWGQERRMLRYREDLSF
jgi:hypothetical protein